MTLARSIAKNVSVQIVGRAIGTVLGLLTIGVLTRYLGTAGYGVFTTATSYLQFVGVFVDFGLTTIAVTMLSEPNADEPRILGNLVSLRIITAVAIFAVAPFIALAIPWSDEVHRAIFVGAASFVFLALNQIFVGLFQRTLRMEHAAIAEVLGRATLLIATIIAVNAKSSIPVLMVALGLANLVMVAASFFFARRLRPFRLRFEPTIIRTIISRSWPIAVSIIFNLVYLRGDMIILSLTRNEHEVGLYGAAYKPLDVITVLPMLFMGLMLPLLVRAWSTQDTARMTHLMRRATDSVSLLAFPIAAGGIALATPLMVFLAGVEFTAAGPLLALLTIAAGCVFFGSLYGHAIVAIGRQRTMLWVYAGDAILCLMLYLIYIPRYGATAGALITILSELIIVAGGGIILSRTIQLKPHYAVPIKALIASMLMALALAALPGVHVLLRILLGAVLYGGLLILMRTLRRSDIDALILRKTV